MYTKSDFIRQLDEMGAPRDSVVLVHASLKAVGGIEGRGETLLDALIDYFAGESGGILLFPTHTWDRQFDPSVYTLDVPLRSCCTGTLPNLALRDPRGVRSLHPTHSVVAFSHDPEKAKAFVDGEIACHSPAPAEGVYGKLIRAHGKTLLIGVGQNRNTILHGIEESLGVPHLHEIPTDMTVRTADGTVIETYIHRNGCESAKFPKFETPFRVHGAITDGFIGDAPTELCDVDIMVAVMQMMLERSGHAELCNDEPFPEAWYR